MSDLIEGVLIENGFDVSAEDEDGIRRATKEVYGLSNGCLWQLDLQMRSSDDRATLSITRTGGTDEEGNPLDPVMASASNTIAEMASSAVAYAHKSAQ